MQILDKNSQIKVSGLYVYPIKSCKGIELKEASFDKRGIVHDRAWGIVNKEGNVLTQRDLPAMALLEPTPEENGQGLGLIAPGMTPISIPAPDQEEKTGTSATVWSDLCQALDYGDMAAAWLSEYLKLPVRLVRISESEKRPVGKKGASYKESTVNFQDVYPLLIISEESLNQLNSELETPVRMNRFRPNIVVKGTETYGEDSWRQIKIGNLKVDVVEPCARCVVTTIEQETGDKGSEPLKTLAKTRLSGNKALFGQNAIHINLENISIGDRVEVLR